MLTAFNSLCDWIEMEAYAELSSLGELHDKMQELSGSDNTYTPKRLKQKLLDCYGDHNIYFSEVVRTTDVLCFRDMVNYILRSWHANNMDNTEDEANRIILTEAKFIKAEMRNTTYDLNNYPCENDIKSSDRGLCFLP